MFVLFKGTAEKLTPFTIHSFERSGVPGMMFINVRFYFLTTRSMKMTVFWDVGL
jgi:hypothetical protein